MLEDKHRNDKWIVDPAWLQNSPSRKDGMKAEDEKRSRRRTCLFIDECGQTLKLPKLVVMTAQAFLHRFFAYKSFKKHDRFVVAQACTFLAAKVEESPVRLPKVIAMCHQVRYSSTAGFKQLDPNSPEMKEKKETVLMCERELLYTIEFDVHVENPMMPYTDLYKRLCDSGIVDAAEKQSFAQTGINFISDSMRTNLCLQHDPQKIASACTFLTVVYTRKLASKIEKPKLNKLFAILSISERSLNSICDQMAEIYLETQNKRCENFIHELYRMGHVRPELYLKRYPKAAAGPNGGSSNGVKPPSPSNGNKSKAAPSSAPPAAKKAKTTTTEPMPPAPLPPVPVPPT